MTDLMSPTPQVLLAHVGWVRSLAHCLVSDPQLADDLAQETWVSALRSPPGVNRNVRGWLAQVLRNLVRQNCRATGRRDRHEHAAARADRAPSTAELVERVSSHRAVVGEVVGLEEPYRTAVLLRFFEGMPPRKIAQELELPVSTVHTRIQRGLKMLRARLDHLHGGDRRSWLLSILPLANREGGATGALLGALFMKTKLQILFGTLLVAIGVVAAWPLVTGGGGEPARTHGPSAVAAPLTVTGESGGPELEEFQRSLLPAGQQTVEVAARAAAIPVRGRLLDSEAQPLPGMALQFGAAILSSANPGGEPAATTGDRGEFEFLVEGGSGQIVVAEEGWTTVLAAVINANRPPEHALVVAAPAVSFAGRVVDEFGVSLPGATVEVVLPRGFRTRFTENSDAAGTRTWRTLAADDGTFALEDAAQIAGATLLASNPGFDQYRQPLPQQDERGIEIVLRHTARADDTVSGQVIDGVGAVVEGAWVAIGTSSTKSDDQGSFTLKLSDQGPTNRILAVKAGYRPARLERPVDGEGQHTDWPITVVLRLGDTPLTISGTVIDERGEPMAAVRVWIDDPTLFGRADGGMVTVEGVASGGTTRSVLQELLAGVSSEEQAMAIMNRTSRADWNWVRTDDRGHFELGGLSQRDYRLRAIFDETLLMVDTDPITAGRRDVVIQMPADAYYSTVAGQVVSHSGIPVTGVTVRPMGDTFIMRDEGQPLGTMHAIGEQTMTDAEGRFEIGNMPRTDIYLRLDGENILPEEYGRFTEGGIETLSGGAVENLRVVVSVRIHVQVELDDPRSADRIRILDMDRQPVVINVFAGNSRTESTTLQLVEGRTPVIVVPDTAEQMVFLKDGEEVKVVNLGLIPGEINRIRW